MQALISPNEKSQYISSWTQVTNPDGTTGYDPVFTVVGERVAEVSATPFEVASPLFWVTCPDAAIADQWYFDPASKTVIQKPTDAPIPA
jgi:hypothetical protein